MCFRVYCFKYIGGLLDKCWVDGLIVREEKSRWIDYYLLLFNYYF